MMIWKIALEEAIKFVIFIKCYQGYQMRASMPHEGDEYEWDEFKYVKGSYHLGDEGVDGKQILNLGRELVDSIQLAQDGFQW